MNYFNAVREDGRRVEERSRLGKDKTQNKYEEAAAQEDAILTLQKLEGVIGSAMPGVMGSSVQHRAENRSVY